MKLKAACSLEEKTMINLDSILKSRDITLLTKVCCLVKAIVFLVVTYGCASWSIKKAEVPKNWCFWTVVWENTLESPLDCKEIQPVYPKGNQSWIFIGRTDAEAEAPMLWPPDTRSSFIGKDPDAGKDWREERRQQRVRWLDGISDSLDMSSCNSGTWWRIGKFDVLQFMGLQSRTLLSNWPTTKMPS